MINNSFLRKVFIGGFESYSIRLFNTGNSNDSVSQRVMKAALSPLALIADAVRYLVYQVGGRQTTLYNGRANWIRLEHSSSDLALRSFAQPEPLLPKEKVLQPEPLQEASLIELEASKTNLEVDSWPAQWQQAQVLGLKALEKIARRSYPDGFKNPSLPNKEGRLLQVFCLIQKICSPEMGFRGDKVPAGVLGIIEDLLKEYAKKYGMTSDVFNQCYDFAQRIKNPQEVILMLEGIRSQYPLQDIPFEPTSAEEAKREEEERRKLEEEENKRDAAWQAKPLLYRASDLFSAIISGNREKIPKSAQWMTYWH